MEVLRIEYETGYMELIVDRFFPCPVQKMRKAAWLINQYCSDEAKAELRSVLRKKADGYAALCKTYRQKMVELPEGSSEYRYLKAQFNKGEILRKRTEQNIEMITPKEK